MWGEEVHDSSSGVAYRRAGSGPSVLLLHGIPGSAASWQPVATRLPGTFDVIVPDLLGFGDSSRPRSLEGAGHFLPHERPDDVVAEIVALVDRTSRT